MKSRFMKIDRATTYYRPEGENTRLSSICAWINGISDEQTRIQINSHIVGMGQLIAMNTVVV